MCPVCLGWTKTEPPSIPDKPLHVDKGYHGAPMETKRTFCPCGYCSVCMYSPLVWFTTDAFSSFVYCRTGIHSYSNATLISVSNRAQGFIKWVYFVTHVSVYASVAVSVKWNKILPKITRLCTKYASVWLRLSVHQYGIWRLFHLFQCYSEARTCWHLRKSAIYYYFYTKSRKINIK